jgi:aminopeptidase N
MTKSNFGGMENLGNTTIVTNAALITAHTLDAILLYAHAVIVHEFEHNQCGSETTMETPFDVWLNEAYTVDVERQFMADTFDPAFVRLRQVDSMRAPLAGPLAIEDAGHYGRIVRDGFNEPDELIDGVTYVKAAEVISMLRLLIGAEAFRAAKTLYFERYRYGNANNDQFFACFEEVSGADLASFKKEWLYRIGYPKLSAETSYDAGSASYRIRFTQKLAEGEEPFCLPLKLALVDGDGRDIDGTERVFIIKEAATELVFDKITEAPAIASMNRDASFYGTFEHTNAADDALITQTRLDPNTFNRVDAMRRLTDRLRVGLLEDPAFAIGEEWLALYGEILTDTKLAPALKAYFLRIDEQPLDRSYSAWYLELVAAREKLVSAVNGRYRGALLAEFARVGAAASGGATPGEGIGERMLRNVLLELIVSDDTPESHGLILDSFRTATTATERVAALALLNRSSEGSRLDVLGKVYAEWHTHLSGYANYLRVVGGGTCADVFEMISREKGRESFDITQPTWSRALFMSMAGNNKMVWTDEGIAWVADTIIQLAPINASVAGFLLNTFQHVHNLRGDLGGKVTTALERIVEGVSKEASVSVNGQAKTYLG